MIGHIGRQAAGVDLEVANNFVPVGRLQLQQLMDPMSQLDIRVPAHLAERRRRFD